MAVDYEWRLRVLMAENGMFKAIDLAPRLAEHGIRLSDSQIYRLVTGRPERVNLRLMMVLCEILGCEPGELVKRTDVAAVADTEPAGGCRGSRVARAIARRRSGSAATDCRSRRAQIAGGSGRATGRRPVSRSVRSAPLRAVPSCASAAVSGASLTVASMAGSSARPA